MNILGRNIEVGVGLETLRGTPIASSRWSKKITSSILPKVEKVVDEGVFGALEDSDNARIVKEWAEGSLEGNLHADLIGYLFANLYGSVVPTDLGDGAYSHLFTLEQSIEHPSLSIFRKDGGIVNEKFGGGVVNSLEISAKAGELIKFSADIILGTKATSTEVVSYAPEYNFVGRDITVKMADTEAELVGATAIKIKEMKASFKANAITDYKMGSYNPDVYNGVFAPEVEFVRNYGDTTFKDLYEANTYKYIQITIEGEADIGGGKKPKLVILLNKAQVMSREVSDEVSALSEETISLKAFYNSSDSEASSVVLQNKTDSYVIGS